MRLVWVLFFLSAPAWARLEVTPIEDGLRVDWFGPPRDELTSPSDEGAPDLPYWSRVVAVPPGHRVVLAEEGATLRSSAVPVPVVPVAAKRHCGGPLAARADSRAYERNRRALAVELGPVEKAGPLTVARLTFRPARLGETDRDLREADHLWARVRFLPTGYREPQPFVSPEEAKVFEALPLNEPTWLRSRATAEDLLIVHPDFQRELSFMRWIQLKEELGREVRVRFIDTKDTRVVQELIKTEYATNRPTHTILVGGIDKIPSFRRNGYWSDFPYTLLDSGNLPDLSLGRLPARNGAELGKFIDKIIARERNPREDGKVLLTSGYETNWCQKNLAFIQTSILSHSPVALTVTKLYASEGKKTDAVIGGYNDDPNFIVYDGHGNETSMTEIPLAISHLGRIKNRVFPILFDIACLNSYWPSSGAGSENFSHSMFSLAEAGVAGILSSTSSGNAHDLFRFIFRGAIYDDLTPSNPHHKLNEVGAAVLYGKLKYLEQSGTSGGTLDDCQMFHYFGDPASRLFTMQ